MAKETIIDLSDYWADIPETELFIVFDEYTLMDFCLAKNIIEARQKNPSAKVIKKADTLKKFLQYAERVTGNG